MFAYKPNRCTVDEVVSLWDFGSKSFNNLEKSTSLVLWIIVLPMIRQAVLFFLVPLSLPYVMFLYVIKRPLFEYNLTN